jgi:Skp family chaperone for outer membrane proteins
MKLITKSALAAIAFATVPMAFVTSAQAQVVQGVATANYEAAVKQANAYKAAMQQMQTTYKVQIDQFNSRNGILQSELRTLYLTYQAAEKANPNSPALKTQAQAIQAKEQAGNAELQRLSMPIARVQAYVDEQFDAKLETAVRAAMKKKNVGMLLAPTAIIAIAPGNDMTPDITAELNASVPSVSINVPANWQPGGQQAQPGAPRPAAPAAPAPGTPAPAPKPQGR